MQAVPATACDGIVEGKLQIVVPQEPVEGRPCITAPAVVASDPVSLEACRYRSGGLNRLLIEAGFVAPLVIKALRSDRYEIDD